MLTEGEIKMKKKNKRNINLNRYSMVAFSAVIALVFCLTIITVMFSTGEKVPDATGTAETTEAEVSSGTPYVVSTAKIGSAGDVLIHKPILESARNSSTGEYSFNKLFTYTKSVVEDFDYFVLNLETTLGGNEGRNYSTYPMFNSPDSLLDSLKNMGVDCLLTANNHSYDTGESGMLRTVQKVDEYGFDHVGTRSDETQSKYHIEKVNGIRFGFTCYTYETAYDSQTVKALNGLPMNERTSPLINSFDYDHLDTFYTEIEGVISQLKKKSDIVAIYIHWGDEYQLSANSYQKAIAQKLCDMGVDVIIGGHPHVVQPMELLSSTDGKHKTVCIYSVGNFVSNQRRNLMGLKTGHTEDGAIFQMTFSKYSDGTVTFDKVHIIPTWVHLYNSSSKQVHAVTPLVSKLDSRAERIGLTNSSSGLSLAKESYLRTTELTRSGRIACNRYLASLPKPDEMAAAQ